MPSYCWKCTECGNKEEALLFLGQASLGRACSVCGADMPRDYNAENVIHNFHPSVDMYLKGKAQKKKRR
jgi:predicted nucleic acid-binding Zn ribbon protein